MSSTATDVHRASADATDAVFEKSHNHNLNITSSHNGMTISPELFEKLYLTPKTPRHGNNVKRFANAVPMGFTGFVISTFTFSMILMGFAGTSSLAGVVGIFFFTGPVLLGLAAIFEWIMGNFFTMNSLSLFCVFWLSFGMIQLPSLGIAASYSATGNAAEGAASPDYNNAIGLYLIVWGFAFVTYFIFSLKTNAIFAGIFGFAAVAVYILAGAYFHVATGDYVMAHKLQHAGGALLFVVAVLGWYITFVIMAAEMRLGINFPVGDLSHLWPSTDVELTEIEKQA